MIYDEHRKNANRSKLRKNRPADLLFHARFSASRALLKSPIFGEADRVAQRSTAILALAFLILTKFIGHKVYGARSWLHLGPVNFQPAQLAVIAGIMVLSLFLSQFKQMHPMLRLTLCGAIVGAPCLLILMQPDLGECI